MKKSIGVLILGLISSLLMMGCQFKLEDKGTPSPMSTSASTEQAELQDKSVVTITCIYIGQIDNNSIEIKMIGLPEERAYRAFGFSDESKSAFKKMELNPNEIIRIEYRERDKQQPLILKIERAADQNDIADE